MTKISFFLFTDLFYFHFLFINWADKIPAWACVCVCLYGLIFLKISSELIPSNLRKRAREKARYLSEITLHFTSASKNSIAHDYFFFFLFFTHVNKKMLWKIYTQSWIRDDLTVIWKLQHSFCFLPPPYSSHCNSKKSNLSLYHLI